MRWRTVTIDNRKFKWVAGVTYMAVREKQDRQKPKDNLLQAILDTPDALNNSDLSQEMHRTYVREAIERKIAPPPVVTKAKSRKPAKVKAKPKAEPVTNLCCDQCAKPVKRVADVTKRDLDGPTICAKCVRKNAWRSQ